MKYSVRYWDLKAKIQQVVSRQLIITSMCVLPLYMVTDNQKPAPSKIGALHHTANPTIFHTEYTA